MKRAVLDANVVASGVLGLRRYESTPGAIFRHWQAGTFTLVTSTHLMGEVERALTDPFFRARLPAAEISAAIAALLEGAEFTVAMASAVAGVATHPEDDLVLAAAVSAGSTIW